MFQIFYGACKKFVIDLESEGATLGSQTWTGADDLCINSVFFKQSFRLHRNRLRSHGENSRIHKGETAFLNVFVTVQCHILIVCGSFHFVIEIKNSDIAENNIGIFC